MRTCGARCRAVVDDDVGGGHWKPAAMYARRRGVCSKSTTGLLSPVVADGRAGVEVGESGGRERGHGRLIARHVVAAPAARDNALVEVMGGGRTAQSSAAGTWWAAWGCQVRAGGGARVCENRPTGGEKTMSSRPVETDTRGRAVDVDGHGSGTPSSRLRARARDAPPGDVQGRDLS